MLFYIIDCRFPCLQPARGLHGSGRLNRTGFYLKLYVEAPGAAAVAGTGGGGEELIETDWDLKAPFDAAGEYAYLPELADPATAAGAGEREGEAPTVTECWALLRFEQPVTCPADSILIGSRLDFDAHAKACRLAVSGRLRRVLSPDETKPEQFARVRARALELVSYQNKFRDEMF